MIAFYHNKGTDTLKFDCTSPNLEKNCFHNSTTSKFHTFTESDKNLLEKIREKLVGGPSIVFTRQVVVEETFVGIRQTGGSPLSEVMLVIFIFSLCVKHCQLACTQDGNQNRTLANS